MSHLTTCPHCSARLRVSDQITGKTLVCPQCLADMDNPQPGYAIRAADIHTDVKRGLSTGSIVLLVLIGLSIIGIGLSFLSFQDSYLSGMLLLFSFFLLEVLVGVAIVRGLVRWGISGVQAPSAARILGIVFVSLGTVVAVVIFFFFTCMGIILLHD